MNQSYRTGSVIKSLRVSAGYGSSRALARDCSLSRETLRNIENGSVLPTNDSLFHILKVIGVSLDSDEGREVIASLYEDRRSLSSGSAAANSELSKYLSDSDVSDEKIEQLITLFSEYINPDRQSDSFIHFLRNRITQILE